MKIPRLSAFLIATLFSNLVHAQSADNPLYRHIPADADKVFHINFSKLSTNIDWKSLSAVAPKKDDLQKLVNYLSDPAQAGVDAGPGVLIAQSNSTKPDSPQYTTVLFAVSDSAKLIKLLREGNKPNTTNSNLVIHPGKPRTATLEKTTLAWNDKVMVMTFVKVPMAQPQKATVQGTADVSTRKYMLAATRKAVAALKGFDSSPYLTDNFFREGFADDADFHLYTRMNAGLGFATTMMQVARPPMDPAFLKASQQMKNNFARTVGALRFDAGKITYRTRVIYDSIGKLDFGGRPMKTDLVEHLPPGNLLGLATLHLDMESYLKMMQVIQKGKSLHMLDSVLAKSGLKTSDIFAAFKGDIVIAAIDNGKAPEPATDSLGKPRLGTPDFFFIFTVRDKAAFDKVNSVIHLIKDPNAPATDTAKGLLHKWKRAYAIHDDTYVLAPNQQAADDYFSKPGRGSSRLLTEEVKESPFAIAIDIKAISEFLKPVMSGGSQKNQQAQVILGLFDMLSFTSAQVHGSTMETTVELRMADQQKNSLQTLMQLLPHQQ